MHFLQEHEVVCGGVGPGSDGHPSLGMHQCVLVLRSVEQRPAASHELVGRFQQQARDWICGAAFPCIQMCEGVGPLGWCLGCPSGPSSNTQSSMKSARPDCYSPNAPHVLALSSSHDTSSCLPQFPQCPTLYRRKSSTCTAFPAFCRWIHGKVLTGRGFESAVQVVATLPVILVTYICQMALHPTVRAALHCSVLQLYLPQPGRQGPEQIKERCAEGNASCMQTLPWAVSHGEGRQALP